MPPFAELGALVEHHWRNQNYNEDLFPEIAAAALNELNPAGRVDPWEIIRWVHQTPDLPEQMDLPGKFGNPPITLFVGPRFFIDAYYWLDGTTTIHQHSFSGAFQVLLGGSVHTTYQFEKELEINPHFLIGRIRLADVSLLGKGDIREINPGSGFVHSLFHLERPSVTITIRTYRSPSAPVQYSYLKPSVAINPFFTDSSLTKKIQTVSLLLGMKHPRADDFIGELVETADFQTAYLVLEQAFHFLCHRELEEIMGVTRSRDRFQNLLDRARRKHGELADFLLPVFEEAWRQAEITRRRAEIKGEAHRFFLALLLNVPDRTTVLRLVQEKFPDQDPVDLIVGWVRELSITKIFGSRESNVLGIGDFDDRRLLVFRGLVEGLTEEEIKGRMASEAPVNPSLGPPVEELTLNLRSSALFKTIFS